MFQILKRPSPDADFISGDQSSSSYCDYLKTFIVEGRMSGSGLKTG